jgi:hypothetical protein
MCFFWHTCTCMWHYLMISILHYPCLPTVLPPCIPFLISDNDLSTFILSFFLFHISGKTWNMCLSESCLTWWYQVPSILLKVIFFICGWMIFHCTHTYEHRHRHITSHHIFFMLSSVDGQLGELHWDKHGYAGIYIIWWV